MGWVDDDEEALGGGEEGAVGAFKVGVVEELAALPLLVASGENEGLMERGGAEARSGQRHSSQDCATGVGGAMAVGRGERRADGRVKSAGGGVTLPH